MFIAVMIFFQLPERLKERTLLALTFPMGKKERVLSKLDCSLGVFVYPATGLSPTDGVDRLPVTRMRPLKTVIRYKTRGFEFKRIEWFNKYLAGKVRSNPCGGSLLRQSRKK